jgi:hypothetical protein
VRWLERHRARRDARRCPGYPDCDCNPDVPYPGQRVVIVHHVPPPEGYTGTPVWGSE